MCARVLQQDNRAEIAAATVGASLKRHRASCHGRVTKVFDYIFDSRLFKPLLSVYFIQSMSIYTRISGVVSKRNRAKQVRYHLGYGRMHTHDASNTNLDSRLNSDQRRQCSTIVWLFRARCMTDERP